MTPADLRTALARRRAADREVREAVRKLYPVGARLDYGGRRATVVAIGPTNQIWIRLQGGRELRLSAVALAGVEEDR